MMEPDPLRVAACLVRHGAHFYDYRDPVYGEAYRCKHCGLYNASNEFLDGPGVSFWASHTIHYHGGIGKPDRWVRHLSKDVVIKEVSHALELVGYRECPDDSDGQ